MGRTPACPRVPCGKEAASAAWPAGVGGATRARAPAQWRRWQREIPVGLLLAAEAAREVSIDDLDAWQWLAAAAAQTSWQGRRRRALPTWPALHRATPGPGVVLEVSPPLPSGICTVPRAPWPLTRPGSACPARAAEPVLLRAEVVVLQRAPQRAGQLGASQLEARPCPGRGPHVGYPSGASSGPRSGGPSPSGGPKATCRTLRRRPGP